MRITIIGAGNLGSAMAAALDRLGHQVTLTSRHRAAGEQAAARLALARTAEAADSVEGADLVIVAVSFSGLAEALGPVADALTGTVVWSCVNALTPDLSGLAVGFTDSAAETVARLLPGARVVAALPPFAAALAGGLGDYHGVRASTFVCGDDPAANAVVGDLLAQLGSAPVEAGPLQRSRLTEPMMMLLVALAYSGPTPRDIAFALLERPTSDRGV